MSQKKDKQGPGEDFLVDEDIDEEIEFDDDAPNMNEDDDDGDDNYEDEGDDEDEDDDAPMAGPEIECDEPTLKTKVHSDSVFCLALSNDGSFAVSGGEDDRGLVWDTKTGKIIIQSGRHKDSVTCVSINSNETLIATADMGGGVFVLDSKDGDKKWEEEFDDVHWMKFHPVEPHLLFIGTEGGALWVYDVVNLSRIITLQGGNQPCLVGAISHKGNLVAAGYGDGSVRIWNWDQEQMVHAIKDHQAHKESVLSLDIKEDGSLVGSGSMDGTVKLISTNSGKVVATLGCEKPAASKVEPSSVAASGGGGGSSVSRMDQDGDDAIEDMEDDEEVPSKSVEGLAFCKSLAVVATGTINGDIEIWELSTFKRRCLLKHEGGITHIKWDPVDPAKLFSSGTRGDLCAWDARTGKLLHRIQCHAYPINDFALSSLKQDQVIVTVSDDSTCRTFPCK